MRAVLRHFKRSDPVIGALIERHGDFSIKRKSNHYESLCQAIIFQQLSMASASSIYRRFRKLHSSRVTPERTLSLPTKALLGAGLSGMKAGYVKGLAQKFSDGTVRARSFSSMNDDEILADLLSVKGIGEWTAQMFLIFSLGRLDVLPVGDLGLRRAVMRNYSLPEMPDRKQLLEIGEKWAPYRTVATWYLWKSADNDVKY